MKPIKHAGFGNVTESIAWEQKWKNFSGANTITSSDIIPKWFVGTVDLFWCMIWVVLFGCFLVGANWHFIIIFLSFRCIITAITVALPKYLKWVSDHVLIKGNRVYRVITSMMCFFVFKSIPPFILLWNGVFRVRVLPYNILYMVWAFSTCPGHTLCSWVQLVVCIYEWIEIIRTRTPKVVFTQRSIILMYS